MDLCRFKSVLNTHLSGSRPSVFTFKVDPGIDVWDREELGNLGVRHHFWLRTRQDTHGYDARKYTSDLPLLKASLLGNFPKGDLAARRDHIENVISADGVNADEIGDLETKHELEEKSGWDGVSLGLTPANLKSTIRGSRRSSWSSAVASRTVS